MDGVIYTLTRHTVINSEQAEFSKNEVMRKKFTSTDKTFFPSLSDLYGLHSKDRFFTVGKLKIAGLFL